MKQVDDIADVKPRPIEPNTALGRLLNTDAMRSRLIQAAGQNYEWLARRIIVVAEANPKLYECEPESVVAACIQANDLELSTSPSMHETAIIPYMSQKRGNKAQLQIMVKGLKTLALRTGKYHAVNAFFVYDGETVVEDRLTGKINIEGKSTPDAKIVGYCGYFKMWNGYESYLYMSRDAMFDHARRYSPAWNKERNEFAFGTPWRDDFDKMGLKTVMKLNLIRNGDLTPAYARFIATEDIIDEHNPAIDLRFRDDSDEGPENAEKNDFDNGTYRNHTKNVQNEALPSRPYTPNVLRVRLAEIAERKYKVASVTQKQRSLLAMLLSEIFAGEGADEKRHAVQQHLFGSASAKDIHAGLVAAALDWLKPAADSGGAYHADPLAAQEALEVWKTIESQGNPDNPDNLEEQEPQPGFPF